MPLVWLRTRTMSWSFMVKSSELRAGRRSMKLANRRQQVDEQGASGEGSSGEAVPRQRHSLGEGVTKLELVGSCACSLHASVGPQCQRGVDEALFECAGEGAREREKEKSGW